MGRRKKIEEIPEEIKEPESSLEEKIWMWILDLGALGIYIWFWIIALSSAISYLSNPLSFATLIAGIGMCVLVYIHFILISALIENSKKN